MTDEAPAVLRLVAQRHPCDCAVAALAMLTGFEYEDVLLAVGDPQAIRKGMYLNAVQSAARRLGVKLVRRRKYDLETDTGIINVVGKGGDFDHVLMLRYGLFFDTNYCVWEPELYLVHHGVQARTLLVREET